MPATPRRPNLLFILVDQMRYCAMRCAGNEQIHTPNLDRLAAEGACFPNAASNIPVCTPARACLLTGRYPLGHTTLTNNSLLPNEMPSVGKMLRAAGYETGYIGKWHLAGEAFIGATEANEHQPGWIPPGPMRHGFDYWAVHHCTHQYWNAHYFRDTPEPIPVEGWEPTAQTDLALEYLRTHAGTEAAAAPFALFLSWGPPHTPFTAPPEFEAMYDPAALRLRPNVRPSDIFLSRVDDRVPPEAEGDPEKALRIYTARYYAAITSLDHELGRLLEALDARGLAEDTVVVFTSDHGDMLGSHGQLHKIQPWDESVRIPFLLRYPRTVRGGQRPDVPLNLPDVLPTLFGLMGQEIPAGVEGLDLAPILRGEGGVDQEAAFLIWPCSAVTWGKKWTDLREGPRGFPFGWMRPYRGIRTRTHTYVRHRAGPWFLYDNAADPFQMENRIETRGPDAVPPELDRLLDAWLERTGDGFEPTAYYRDLIDLETGLVREPDKLRTR